LSYIADEDAIGFVIIFGTKEPGIIYDMAACWLASNYWHYHQKNKTYHCNVLKEGNHQFLFKVNSKNIKRKNILKHN
jgi:hypothetical protein